MRRHELTDFEWKMIEPLLPNKPRGVPRVNDRRVLNGILWRLCTGSLWRDIPERYGPSPVSFEYTATEHPHEMEKVSQRVSCLALRQHQEGL